MSAQHPALSETSRHRISRESLARVRRWWNGFLDNGVSWTFDGIAEQRALELLKQKLTPVQREQFNRRRSFDVAGGSTGTRYRIHRGHQMNVEELWPDGKRAHLLCFMPMGPLPIADILLAQKVALETFECDALAAANKILGDPRRNAHFSMP
jgi:hypothetical protein